MKEYKKDFMIYFKRTEWGSVSVRAKNPEEARGMAFDEYDKGNVCWHKEEIDDIDVQKPYRAKTK